MVSRVTTTFNCIDAYALSEWWKQVLGYTDLADDPNEPGHEECLIVDPVSGHRLLFIEVEELQGPGRPETTSASFVATKNAPAASSLLGGGA